MLRTNARSSKLAATRVEYGRQGMLDNDVLTSAKIKVGFIDNARPDIRLEDCALPDANPIVDDEDEAGHYDGSAISSLFELAKRLSKLLCLRLLPLLIDFDLS